MKSTLVRTAAAAAATVLVTVGGVAPALADHDHGNGASQDHRAAAAQDHKAAKAAKAHDHKAANAHDHKADRDAKDSTGRQGSKQDHGNNGRGEERGNGHTPVTVCHLLGNGSYILLTFDDNALEAHLNHGDIAVPAEGCPAATTEETVPGTTTPEENDTPGVAGDDSTVEDDVAVQNGSVAGVEAFDSTVQPRTAQVLGVEALAGVNRSAPAAGPIAGILPQTGAGQLGLAAAAGLLLVGAGATMVARRRTQGA